MRRIVTVFILFLFALVLAQSEATGQTSLCDWTPYSCGVDRQRKLDQQNHYNQFLQEQALQEQRLREMQRRLEEERLEKQREEIERRRFQEILDWQFFWETLRRNRR